MTRLTYPEDTAQEATMSRTKKPEIVQQYGIRWQTGVVFAFQSREDAEEALRKDGRGVGVLVVHEGVPGRSSDEWTDWQEVES